MAAIGNDWDEILKDEFTKDYYQRLMDFLDEEYAQQEIYPPRECIFNALRFSSYEDTKVVILGQDPYHEPGQAHGLCFSVNKWVKIPPSLVNIYEEAAPLVNTFRCAFFSSAGTTFKNGMTERRAASC